MLTTQTNSSAAVQGATTDAQPVLSATEQHLESLRHEAIALAATDSAFREALLRAPHEALSGLVQSNSDGIYTLSKGVEVIALENTSTTMNIVVPSADKAETATGELAALALELQANPSLVADLKGSPRATLERFLSAYRGREVELPRDIKLHLVTEQPGELIIAVPRSAAEASSVVPASELSEGERIEPRTTYQCLTHGCHTATPSCMISSGCQSSGCFTSTWGCTGSC
jgi:hypothetical protein